MTPDVLDTAAVMECPAHLAVMAIRNALIGGVDPSQEPRRSIHNIPAGLLLLMPSCGDQFAGVKVVGVAPGNRDRGMPLIQGSYLLMDAATLAPRAFLDGAALTVLRTAAVSAAVSVSVRAAPIKRLVVFGTGPQARGHIAVLAQAHGDGFGGVEQLIVVGRSQDKAEEIAAAWRPYVSAARAGAPADVAGADAVVCTTSAKQPVFDGCLVSDGALVIAVGAHGPGEAELDVSLMARSQVIVEDQITALEEAGEVIMAMTAGVLDPADLIPMADVVTERTIIDPTQTTVFKSNGMAWQDLAVASAAFAHHNDAAKRKFASAPANAWTLTSDWLPAKLP